jgi:hypothetical protein
MVVEKHADIRLTDDQSRLSELGKIARPGDIIVSYRVRLPFGNIVFSMKGGELSGKLFGQKPVLSRIPHFLEKIAGKGLHQLEEAAQSKGDIAALLAQAVRTRLVADIIEAAASNGPVKAAKILQRRYPIGIRAASLPPLVVQANLCLRNLSRQPRLIGFGIGFILCALLDTAYLIGPLRGMVQSAGGPLAALAADAALPVAGIAIAATLVLMTCARAINKVLGKQKKKNAKTGGKKLTPKPGQSIATGTVASLLAFIVILHIAFMTGHAPSWYLALMHMDGL